MKIRAMTITMFVLAAGALMMQGYAGTLDPRAEQLWQQAIHTSGPPQEFALLLEAAKLGHPRAEAAVGNDYWSGWGVREDDAQAAYWLQLAAAQGNRGAQFSLAGMYTMGKGGLRVDLPRAAELLTASARQDYTPAQLALGVSYEFAEGVSRNRQTAVYWLSQAAAQGDPTAATLSRVLTDPRTPQFQSEAQLANYITGQQNAGSGNAVHRCIPNPTWSPTAGATGPAPAIVGMLALCR